MKAKIKVDLDRQIGSVDRNIYGEFICRRPGCSEGGLYDPHHSLVDKDGLRKDVVEAIRGLKPPIIRWPGGCTGTSYNWIDGVGPIEKRPKKIDLHFGWPALYGFGTDEFIKLYLSMVNRHIDQSMEAEINLGHARIKSEGQSHLLYHEDPMAMNSLANPDNVSPRTEKVEKLSSRFTWTLLPHSYTILEMNLV